MKVLTPPLVRALGLALGRYTKTATDPERAHRLAMDVTVALDLSTLTVADVFMPHYEMGERQGEQVARVLNALAKARVEVDLLGFEEGDFGEWELAGSGADAASIMYQLVKDLGWVPSEGSD